MSFGRQLEITTINSNAVFDCDLMSFAGNAGSSQRRGEKHA